jgi:hypothetical protein
MTTYQIRGQVIQGADGVGIPGHRVEAWDKDALCDDLVGSAITADDGTFQMIFEESYFKELFLDRRPDLYFRVFRGRTLIHSTQDSVLWNVASGDIPVTIEVTAPPSKEEPGPEDRRYVVHGTVMKDYGRAVPDAAITVWRQRIRSRASLVEGSTSGDGSYRVSFGPPNDLSGKLLIVVEARSPQLAAPLQSPSLEAQQELQVDLREEPSDPSELGTLLRGINPLLDDLELTDLVESDAHRDLSFLARELGRSTEEIMRVAVAVRLEAAFGVPAAAFYAFLRQRVPAALPNPLLEASEGFTLIEALVRRVGSLIFRLTSDVQQRTLAAAVADGVIGEPYRAEIPRIVGQLQALRTTDLLEQPFLIGKATLGQLLGVAQLPEAKQQTFAQALATNEQSMRNFWRTLGDGKHGFIAAEASAVERTLSVGSFVKNHLPLVQTLLEGFASGTYKTLPDLARLSERDWVEMVTQAGPPPSIDAAGTASPAEVFARVVYARVTRAYPTAAISSRVVAGKLFPEPQQAPLAQFFQNNPTLELIKHNIPVYLASEGEKAFAGIPAEDRPAIVANARRVQRVLRVVPTVDAAQTLLELGIHSATQIARMGQQQFFVKATQAGLSKRDASRIYRSGVERYAGAVSRYTQFNRDALGIWPSAIGSIADLDQPTRQAIERDQSLGTLFGSQDYCAVDSCTSILSPAAYVCDLLLWLRNHPQGGRTALDSLDDRRPDIRHLLLNCPNTQTPLPYIDLVNELLADAISPPTDPTSTLNPPWKQTSENKTAAELRAAPEYFNQAAYVTLFGASYPHTLPYSAGLDELRTYLDQSKVPLWQVRQALLPLHTPTAAEQAAVAAERLGLAPHDLDLVANPDFITAPVAWNITLPAVPAVVLAAVPTFLGAASLTYESLLELLRVRWVQGALGIRIQGIDDTCDTSIQTLAPAPLDAGFLDRAHRFLRLWRRSGYRMWELDLLLRAPSVGNGTLDLGALVALQAFWQLQGATHLAVDQLLAFYQNLDTESHRDPDGTSTAPLYARIFLNPAVTSVAPDPDLAALPSGGGIVHPNLSDHLPAVQAALGVSGSDAATLFSLTDNQLTLDNLSVIYRVNALAVAGKLPLGDLLNVARMLSPGAPTAAAAVTPLFGSPAATLAFLAQTKSVQQSGFSIDALTYLLTPPAWSTTTQMTEDNIAAALGAVRQAILNPNGGDVNGSVIAAVAANAHRPTDAPLANDVAALVLQLQVPGTGQTLLALLTDPSLVAKAGGVFTPLTSANFPNQFLAIQLFDKVAVVVRRLRLIALDLGWLLANAGTYGGLDFAQLPVAGTQPALALAPLLTTLLLVQLARLFTAAPPASAVQTLYDVIAGVKAGTLGNEAVAQGALATITGWTLSDIVSFAAALGASFPADYEQPATYDALRRLEAMAVAAGATGAQIVAWGAVPADEATAQSLAAEALGALKAGHPNNDDWLALAPGIMNPIRDRRSAALQAYLIGLRDPSGKLIYGDANGLFDHFLIDVQMSSCEVSTRVIQAYIAAQIFVERCLMNLEAPGVVVDLAADDTWNQWEWMKRYRIWEANRQVFLYPENWLIESQRPNRSEIYRKLEQDVRQNESTRDYLETVVLSYIEGLEGVAHLFVTGTCQDPVTGAIHVAARTLADPPVYYHRSLVDGAWTGWVKIPLDIKAHQVVPAVYGGRLCLFWPEVKVANEPRQSLPAAQASSSPPSQDVERYVTLSVFFTIFRNERWAPAQAAKGKLFDKPLLDSGSVGDAKSVESLYTLKVQQAAHTPGFGTNLFVDVFRRGDYKMFPFFGIFDVQPNAAVHVGRAVFDGRFNDLELRNLAIAVNGSALGLLAHAQSTYGPDAQPLLPLPASQADPDIVGEPALVPQAGSLATAPANPAGGSGQTLPLVFTSAGAMEQNVGALLNAAPMPFRVVGPATDLNFDPTSYFFFQDNRRSYYVESQKFYWTGSTWSPVVPSNPAGVQFEVRYVFHRFYHPFARLFWHQLGSGGFPLLYDRNLQLNTDQVDPSGADVFSFQAGYQPVPSRVRWDRDDGGQDREFLDFTRNAAFSLYNWELFFHIPLYIAELLGQNQKFAEALTWFHYIFNPTRPGPDPAPKRFWIPKPLYDLTSAEILAERINNLLVAVDNGDPNAVAQVRSWRRDPFNPFLLADQRPVAYMKRTVMSYLDNLIAWADNLFASESREALSEATLLYVIAAEILGPQPAAVMPPEHADESYDQLEPKLDAFANAMVDIENTMGGTGGGGGGGGEGLPPAHTFYFKIPPNQKLLGYWKTVADRLFKLRHCQNISGVTRQLALFDAPIDPGLLIKARAAGVDIGSVLSDVSAALPNYRFTALYSQALDFVNAVRAYGASLLSAIEKSDSAGLSMLQQTTQQQLLRDGDQILAWQVEQAQNAIDNLNQTLALAQSKYNFNNTQSYMNAAEIVDVTLSSIIIANYVVVALAEGIGAIAAFIPDFMFGAAGFGGSPTAQATEGGDNASESAFHGANVGKAAAAALEKGAALASKQGGYAHRMDSWKQAAAEAQLAINQANIQLASAQLALQIAQQNQVTHQEQIDNIQKQIDFLTNKFTSQELYDWHIGQLASTYFQSYRLAYRLCKQVERCYRFELDVPDSSFIEFGYWDSLRKGLLAGEMLNHDLRQMQASYLEQNKRRFELSRYVSLGALKPAALQQLLATGGCDFDLPESLFDNDYPGHYNRRLVRASVTVLYPSPGKFDNVKATLTLVANKVRGSTDTAAGYTENPVGSDPRFVYNYAAVPQKIVLGNAQDDPGLFLTAIASNLGDQRYLPFENAGVVSSWHLDMPAENNEIDLSALGDVVLHLYYTALDGGDPLKAAVQADNAANVPTSGLKVFSAVNDFGAPAPSAANPSPVSPWGSFLATPPAGSDQVLTLSISPSKFPPWTRGKTITVTGIAVMSISWPGGSYVVQPQAPLPTTNVAMPPVAGATEPNVCSGTVAVPAGTQLGTWSFKIRKQSAADFRSLTKNDLGDVLLLVSFQVS